MQIVHKALEEGLEGSVLVGEASQGSLVVCPRVQLSRGCSVVWNSCVSSDDVW